MRGLFDIFRRHFAVLTNFIGNEVNSRPFGRRWAFLRVYPREGPRGHRPGPQGGDIPVPPTVSRDTRPDPMTTHSHPLQGCPGPASLSWGLPRAVLGSWVVPVLPTRYTHPAVPYPVPSVPSHTELMHHTAVLSTTSTCTYDRFEDTVGEPRGTRTHVGFGVPDWFMRPGQVHTAV